MALIMQVVYQVVNYTRVSSYFLYVPYIVVLALVIISGGEIELPTGYRFLLSGMALCYIVGPMLGRNINFSSYTYSALLMLFSLASIQMGQALSKDICNIKKMALIGALFLIFLVVSHLEAYNLSNIRVALGLTGVRNTTLRASFGFWHPNAAGYMFATEIILLSFTLSLEERLYKKIIEIFLIIVFCVSMLASGSRTAAVTVMVFFSIKIALKYTRAFTRARVIVLSLIFIVFSAYFITNNGLNNLIEASSGRNLAVGNVLQHLKRENKLIFGYGATRISEGGIGITIDNWYLNMLAYYGIFGLICMLGGVLLLVVNLYKIIRLIPNESVKENIISFIIMFFLYGLCENVIYVPGVTLCGVFWMVVNMLYFYVDNNYLKKSK